jgi:hypothetical protein
MPSRIVVLLLLAIAAPPAAADWLVMRDGTRVETRGPWRQDGRLVVFTSAEERLVSLRTSAVDLPASVAATREAVEAAARVARGEGPSGEPPAEPPRQARRITNADIAPGVPRPAAAGPGAAEEGAPPVAAGRGALDVVDSRQSSDDFDGHLIVRGSLVNRAGQTAAAVALTVLAYGPDGELLGSQPAALGAEALPPGESTTFQVDFPDVFTAFALRFVPEGSFLETVPEGEAADGGADFDGADDGFDDPDDAP